MSHGSTALRGGRDGWSTSAQGGCRVDLWKYFDITHRDHVVCNPTSVAKLDEVVGLLDLPPRPRVLEIACGKGELLLRTAERWAGPAGDGFRATAIDTSPFVLRD